MKRRQFVKTTAASLLLSPFVLSRAAPLYADAYASPIVSVTDQLAAGITIQPGSTPNSDNVIVDKVLSSRVDDLRIMHMVDTAVMNLTGKNTLGQAWESLFPPGYPTMNTKIGIKINLSYGDGRNDIENDWSKKYCPYGPKVAITNAIVTGLSQMLGGNFPPENVTLVERLYSIGSRKRYPLIQGYRPVRLNKQGLNKDVREGTAAIHWVFPNRPLEIPDDAPRFLAAPDFEGQYSAPQRIFAAIYKNDFLINYAICKDHRAAGITGVMKNNYGCTDNPLGTHGSQWNDDNSPYAGTKRCVPVFQKHVHEAAPFILNVLDALTTVYEGGPLSGRVHQTNTIAVSRDPVAIDTYELALINKVRGGKGLSVLGTTKDRAPDGHRNATFLRLATEKHELGSMSLDNLRTYDLSRKKKVKMIIPSMDKMQSRIGTLGKGKNGFELMVFLDNSKRNHVIESRIEDVRGKPVRAMKTLKTRSSNTMLAWDFKNDEGKTVKPGFYVWFIRVDGMLHSATIMEGI